jgi:hypothetical protein
MTFYEVAWPSYSLRSCTNDSAAAIERWGENSLSHLIVFTLGYFLGGMTALLLLGLAVAARRGDRRSSERVERSNESTPAWRERL